MIGLLRGRLSDRETGGEVMIDVAGVGYRVVMAPAASFSLGDLGDEVVVQIHHHIREDAQALYGFSTKDERVCFEALLGAHGVGPALALAIMSVHRPPELAAILAADDVNALCLVPGVGKKTAARLLVELQSKLDVERFAGDGVPVSAGSAGGAVSAVTEVSEALATLGYRGDEVRSVLQGLDSDDAQVMLRDALRRLGPKT